MVKKIVVLGIFLSSIFFIAPTVLAAPASNADCQALHGQYSYYNAPFNECDCVVGYFFFHYGTMCVPENTPESCQIEYGDYAVANTIFNTCECTVGYHYDPGSGKCITNNVLCQAIYGPDSFSNYLNNRCECNSGYLLNDQNQCIFPTTTPLAAMDIILMSTVITPTVTPQYFTGLNVPLPNPFTAVSTSTAITTSSVPTALAFTSNFGAGSTNKAMVIKLQQFLAAHGFFTLPTVGVGIYGTKTTAAVKSFQKKNHLPVTGAIDTATRKVLNTLAAS